MMTKTSKIKTLDTLFYDRLGLIMRKARQENKMSLMELSKKTGISRVQLEYYELGHTRIKDEKWQLICEALDIDPKINVSIEEI